MSVAQSAGHVIIATLSQTVLRVIDADSGYLVLQQPVKDSTELLLQLSAQQVAISDARYAAIRVLDLPYTVSSFPSFIVAAYAPPNASYFAALAATKKIPLSIFSDTYTLQLNTIEGNKQLLRYAGIADARVPLVFSPDGRYFAFAEHNVRLYDTKTG